MGYERLTEEFKSKVLAPWWAKYSAQIKDQYGYDLAEEGLKLRHRVQTDGFWLAKDVLGYTEFSDCHKELFTDFFVQKDPGAKDFKTFAESDKDLHDRLLMLSRGGFKSTADIVDCIQYISCFPEIRINIMTGTTDLAEEFTGIIKGHITLNSDGSVKTWDDGRLRLFQILFPEHCETKPGLQPEWTTPARKLRASKEVAGPTIRATSLDKNTTGTHCDVLKIDDGTTAENTKTADRIKSVNTAINMARKLCEPYGYKDRIGTPYHKNDNLVATVAGEEARKEKNLPPLVKILLHPAYTLKKGFEDYDPDELTDEMVDLWFPERLTLKYLQTEYAEACKTDPATFFSQFLLDLNKSTTTKFRRDLMVAATVDKFPEGTILQAWDLAYSEEDHAKYTVGITGLFSGDCIYIIDMARDRYSEYDLPRMMAFFAHKWRARRAAVEDSMGARWLKSEIQREQSRLRSDTPFEFVSLGRGSKAKSKEAKAKKAVRLLGDNRLFFWKALPELTTIYNELEGFPNGTYTDIVCSISLLVNHFSNYVDLGAPRVTVSDRVENLRYKMIYGLGQFAAQNEDQTILALQGGLVQETERDPLADAGIY